MKTTSESIELGNKTLILETGRLASQANAAVVARLGDTMVLATVVSSHPREELDYFPLEVEYVERLYAGGKIKGSRWVKREGRPSDEAILTARLVDRSIRPLFPEGYKNEVQVIITVLSVDAENSPDMLALWATSAALAISDIPWSGPVGAVRVGYIPKNGEANFVANPTNQDLEYSDLDLVISTTEKAVIMLEGGAKNVAEETILKGIEFGQGQAKLIIEAIKNLQKKVGLKKQSFIPFELDQKILGQIKKEAGEGIKALLASTANKTEGNEGLQAIKLAEIEKHEEEKPGTISKAVEVLLKEAVRKQILIEGKRLDGRKPQDLRSIEIEVGILPRTHGSAMFKRGNTQALTVTTLGAPSLGQLIEGMEGEETKRYIHHYYMPPFSVGEVGRLGWPSRREVGHGSLAERALEPVIPSEEKFPYTIRVVSEIMSSNGSTSMASVCGSTLSLMDAGVPIKAPVAGIAMGLISDESKNVILTDIVGLEDFNGDMDFKVAGTEDGVTAIQMDVKTTKLTKELIEKILKRAKEARIFILGKILQAIPIFRPQISRFAPKIVVLHIPVEDIGEVIGPGGKTIRKIISETGATVEVEDDGSINISAIEKESVDKAVAWIKGLTRKVKVEEMFDGVVKRIQPFGAFVEILPGKEGLVHVSRMVQGFVRNPADIVKIGQVVKVRVTEIDDMGRINLSMLLEGEPERAFPRRSTFPRRGGGFSQRRPFRPRQR